MFTDQLQLPDGRIWAAASDFVGTRSPVVIVPIDQLDNLSNAEIGANVRELVRYARFCSAMQKADWVTAYGSDVRECHHHLDELLAAKVLLSEFADESEEIQVALQFIAEVEGYVARKELKKTKIRAKQPGYVYLISGGGYFKIGLTTDLITRHKQIGAKLPFKTEIVHSMKTNDVVGLEQYWHEYFAGKRAEGEWFTLSAEEVAEFCTTPEMEPPS